MKQRQDIQETLEQAADMDLLQIVLTGNEQAWGEMLRRFRGLIFSCITKVLCRYESVISSEAVNEVFSDVCLNLLRNDMKKLRAYDPNKGSKLGSWIGLITVHSTYDHLRVTARQPMLDRLDGVLDREDHRQGPLDDLLDKERWGIVGQLAQGFSRTDRRFLDLYYGRGMTPAEVAHHMNISVKTVYSKKHKIRNRLVEMARTQREEAMAA